MGYFSQLDAEKQEYDKFNKSENKMTETLIGQLFVYDWQYRRLSGFEAKLADLIAHGDTSNQKRLLKAFPEKVQAIMDYQSKTGWWAKCEEDVKNYRGS